ncbi:MAG: sulfoxide reductase heme-binding subunit YedZ [Acidobacteria bacterium]|nr:sulfoxide reductase heme-binding subunit YedZ [Acidobacteriota bacterium]MCW5970765.1 sulfoxide reductase heme-binding subunit YedZ [Blastocatellales bacterium]
MDVEDVKFARLLVFVNAAVPFALLLWDWRHAELGANPLEFVTHTTGMLALIFLTLSLAVTPLRKAAGQPWLIRLRRMIGLYAFFYAALHLLAYVWFDKTFSLGAIIDDTARRPYITLGMFAFFLLVPLAVTSTNRMVKLLGGARWNRLHRAVYIAAIAGVAHYYLLVKADTRKPVAFAIVIGALLVYRLLNKYFPSRTERRPARAS